MWSSQLQVSLYATSNAACIVCSVVWIVFFIKHRSKHSKVKFLVIMVLSWCEELSSNLHYNNVSDQHCARTLAKHIICCCSRRDSGVKYFGPHVCSVFKTSHYSSFCLGWLLDSMWCTSAHQLVCVDMSVCEQVLLRADRERLFGWSLQRRYLSPGAQWFICMLNITVPA